ncbi:lipopolysaccharide biosynthesis protein [Vibrio splendidus]
MLKNVLKVLSGGVLAQALNFLTFPIIASWYGPGAFGDYAVFSFFIAFLPMLMSLRMEMAIMQDPDDFEKNSLIFLSLINSVFILIVCLVISIFFSGSIRLEIVIISSSAFLISLQNMMISVANLKEKYWVLAITRVIFPMFFLLNVWITKEQNLSYPLATSHMFTSILVVIFIFIASNYRVEIVKLEQIVKVLKKYVNYIKFDLPSGLLNASALLLPAYLIGILFDEESSGLYFLAFKLILAPLGALTMAVGYVYRREAVKEFNEKKSFIISTQKVTMFLVALSIMMLITYYSIGPLIFELFFKEDWLPAIPVISILMPMFAIKLIASPLSFSFYIVGKLKLDLYGQLFFITSSVIAIFSGFFFSDFILTVYFIALSSGFVYVIYALKSIQFSKGEAI